jgi:hypothetical protein
MTVRLNGGVAAREEIAELDGRQILQAMIYSTLPAPPMAKTFPFDLVEVGEGFAVVEGSPGEKFLNPMGTVHSLCAHFRHGDNGSGAFDCSVRLRFRLIAACFEITRQRIELRRHKFQRRQQVGAAAINLAFASAGKARLFCRQADDRNTRQSILRSSQSNAKDFWYLRSA